MQKKKAILTAVMALGAIITLPQSAKADNFFHYHNGKAYNKAAKHYHYKHHRRCDRGHYGHSYSRVYHSPHGSRVIYYGPAHPVKKAKRHHRKHKRHHTRHYDYGHHFGHGNNTYVLKLDFDD